MVPLGTSVVPLGTTENSDSRGHRPWLPRSEWKMPCRIKRFFIARSPISFNRTKLTSHLTRRYFHTRGSTPSSECGHAPKRAIRGTCETHYPGGGAAVHGTGQRWREGPPKRGGSPREAGEGRPGCAVGVWAGREGLVGV